MNNMIRTEKTTKKTCTITQKRNSWTNGDAHKKVEVF